MKPGFVKCDNCDLLIPEFGQNSYNGEVFCFDKKIFNIHFHICLKCGEKVFKCIKEEK